MRNCNIIKKIMEINIETRNLLQEEESKNKGRGLPPSESVSILDVVDYRCHHVRGGTGRSTVTDCNRIRVVVDLSR